MIYNYVCKDCATKAEVDCPAFNPQEVTLCPGCGGEMRRDYETDKTSIINHLK